MPLKTELTWDGKYDAHGKRVAPLRVALPFQTVETVNESAQDRAKSLFQRTEQEQPWRNRLIWGDKKYVLPSLLPEFAGKVNLIYIDPPFDTGADFSFTATVPDAEDEDADGIAFTKQPSLIEQKAYRDTWGRGMDSYLQWFYETVVLLKELLAQDGGIYVHCDWRLNSYLRLLLQEVFGGAAYRNEITWKRKTGGSSELSENAKQYSHDSDYILFFGSNSVFNIQYREPDPGYIEKFFRHVDEHGRRYRIDNLANPGYRPNLIYEYKGYKPPRNGWAISLEKMKQWDAEGRLYFPKKRDGRIQRKRFLDELKGLPLNDIWDDVLPVSSQANERTGYPTQKPEALLDRIIKASSNEGDLILDCFVGSGTTAAVAEKLNRRWIACDLGRFAIHTSRKRLLQIEEVRPFVVQNLGKYERQLWQTGQFAREGPETPAQADRRHRAYTQFILNLYGATPITGRSWLHGTKGGRMVHVSGVEAPVTVGDVRQVVAEFKKAIGSGKGAPTSNGIDVLGWDFAFELNEVARQQAADANVRMTFKRIPRDVMDKRAVEQGEIKFFELAALAVNVKAKKQEVTLALTDFVIPPDDVPEDVRGAVKHWSQWIDYWAVDWDNQSDTFHNQWQAFRTRKDNKLPLEAAHEYPEPGEYRIVVKVIDILGNDTTKTVKVKVK